MNVMAAVQQYRKDTSRWCPHPGFDSGTPHLNVVHRLGLSVSRNKLVDDTCNQIRFQDFGVPGIPQVPCK